MGRAHRPTSAVELLDHGHLDLRAVPQVRMAVGVAEPLSAEIRLTAVAQCAEPLADRLELLCLGTGWILLGLGM
jgi:hypothetical protein